MNKFKSISLVLSLTLLLLSSGFGKDFKSAPAQLNVNTTMLKNFLKSLIIPGWGQYASGHKIRALTFLTAELAGIYGYQSNYTAGADGATEFKAYADDHWLYTTWRANGATDDIGCAGNLRTHQMPLIGPDQPLKDHHFYENIGKYPEFSCGWDDYTTGGFNYDYDEDETTNKAGYIKMRTRSNELYRNAQVAGTLIMVNHLISAFEAALGTDLTEFETTNLTGKFYINPLSTANSISLEVKF
ncbi:MAG: hypothetical protein U9Q77_13295 [Candidatus Marinimicrobia bacterium]|nr:hypothetical protein [Candidatus Neomarinimicrobiota bacterium]